MLDLEYETETTGAAPEPATYETAYMTSHKGNCRSGAFSWNGQLCATGSVDASIKLLDVDRWVVGGVWCMVYSYVFQDAGQVQPWR